MTERAIGRPRDPRADRTIMKAALELFVERGIDGASIEQIAKRAGVAKMTVYRRWNSKEALLAQAFESSRDGMPEPDPSEIAEAAPEEIIQESLSSTVDMLAHPTTRAMISRLLGTAVSHPTLIATYWRHYIIPRRRVTHVLLERAKQEGLIDQDTDLDVLIDMMVGAIIWRLLQPEPLDDPVEIRRYLEAVYRQAGLLPRNRQP